MRQLPHIFTDGGRTESGYRHEGKDCTVRALAVASRTSYADAHAAMELAGRRYGDGIPMAPILRRNDIPFYQADIVYDWHKDHKMTINQFIQANPKGNFLVIKRRHAFAVMHGTIMDSAVIGKSTQVLLAAKVTAD